MDAGVGGPEAGSCASPGGAGAGRVPDGSALVPVPVRVRRDAALEAGGVNFAGIELDDLPDGMLVTNALVIVVGLDEGGDPLFCLRSSSQDRILNLGMADVLKQYADREIASMMGEET